MNSEEISQYLGEQGSVFTQTQTIADQIYQVGQKFVEWWQEGRIFLGCGNGGSCAEISHMVGEATIRLRGDDTRPPFLFLNLAADQSIVTAGSNDLGYNELFAHQVKAAAWHQEKTGAKFVLFGVSTSGTSKNVLRAIEEAKKAGIPTVGLTHGSSEKEIAKLADFAIIVPSANLTMNTTQANQTVNLAIWHIWFEMLADEWQKFTD